MPDVLLNPGSGTFCPWKPVMAVETAMIAAQLVTLS